MATIHADKTLQLLENVTGLTPHGKAWLTACIDPFHDEAIPNLTGFPDGANSRSVVQIVRNTMTIQKSVKVVGSTWDCHIISYPWENITEYRKGSTFSRPAASGTKNVEPGDLAVYGTVSTAVPAPPYGYWGGVAAYQNEVNGTAANPFDGTQVIADADLVTLCGPDSNYMQGNYRVIAKGYEVLSVGADLTKSGTVYVWKLPSANSPDISTGTFYYVSAAGATVSSGTSSTVTYDFPPKSISEANLIPSCKSWPQKHGCYIPDIMNGPDNFTWNSQDAAVACRASSITGDSFTTIPAVFSSFYPTNLQFTGTSAATQVSAFQTSSICPFGFSGAYFTGLSSTDVLVVNCIWYIERFPDENQKDLLVLATPTPPRDEVAMAMYSVMASKMPVGMYQNSNNFGDWFKDAISVVTDTVAPVMSMMPGPIGAVGKAVTVGGKALDKLIEKTNDSPSPTSTVDINLKELKKEERARPLRQASGQKKEKKAVKSLTKAVKKLKVAEKKAGKKKRK